MQLLKITSTPIKYDISISPASLKITEPSSVSYTPQHTPTQLQMRTKLPQVKLDTTEMFASLGVKSAPRLIKEAAQNGMQAAVQATGEAVQFGNRMARIDNGVTISSIVKQKMLQQPTSEMVFLPSQGAAISWDPGELQTDYRAGSLTLDWKVQRNVMDYVPGKFEMSILQYPKVTIEYLGGPHYVPPSADPNYDGDAGQ